jgi:dethiobiotin synthetase
MTFGRLKRHGVFITATDTSVGKTTLAAGLAGYWKARKINVGVMKPVSTGAIECESGTLISQDADLLIRFSGAADPRDWINPYCLVTSAVPSIAAKREGVAFDFGKIRDCFLKLEASHEMVIVEGAGGVMTPLFEDRLMVDLIQYLEIPAIVVTQANQGIVNQTLLTIECLKQRGVAVVGFFINRFPLRPNLSESTSAEIISSFSGVPCLGLVPELGESFSPVDLLSAFADALNLRTLEDAFCH